MCMHCQRAFADPGALQRHVRIHTGTSLTIFPPLTGLLFACIEFCKAVCLCDCRGKAMSLSDLRKRLHTGQFTDCSRPTAHWRETICM